jgi:redox-sensitive bicupin YhaK (pirin superfamily)
VTVQVIAGRSHGVAGAVQRDGTEPLYLDIELPAGASFEQALPPGTTLYLRVPGPGVVDGKACRSAHGDPGQTPKPTACTSQAQRAA